jgi:hypothetical protein
VKQKTGLLAEDSLVIRFLSVKPFPAGRSESDQWSTVVPVNDHACSVYACVKPASIRGTRQLGRFAHLRCDRAGFGSTCRSWRSSPSPILRGKTAAILHHLGSETVNVSALAVRVISTVRPSEAAKAKPSELTQRQIPALCHWMLPCSDSIRSSLRNAWTSLSLSGFTCSFFCFMVVGPSSRSFSPGAQFPPGFSR